MGWLFVVERAPAIELDDHRRKGVSLTQPDFSHLQGRSSRQFSGCELDRFANARITAAAAQIARQGGIDGLVVGARVAAQQGDSGHDLAGLAVPALRDIGFRPGLQHGLGRAVGGAFDGGHRLSCGGLQGRDA